MKASGQLHPTTALLPVKGRRCPFNRRLGGPHSRYGRLGEVKKPIAHDGSQTPNHPTHSLAAICAPATRLHGVIIQRAEI
jgi:hypothetical protein